MKEHLLQVYEIECNSNGNAFLTDGGLLITVRHVVAANKREDLSQPYKIMLNPGYGCEKIECQILEHDEDDFENSTLVLLEPQLQSGEKLPHHIQRGKKTIVEVPVSEIVGYIGGTFEEFTIKTAKAIKLQDMKGEKINTGITIEEAPGTCITLSGSPVVCGDNIYGVLIGEKEDPNCKMFKLYALCDKEFGDQVENLRKRLQKKQEAQQKTSQHIPTFAEYVAEACHDRPMGLRILANPSEYTEKYPGQNIKKDKNRLNTFMDYIQLASISGTDECAEMARKDAFSKLKEIYDDKKHLQDVYVSALFGVFERANRNIASAPRNMEKAKRLFDISAQCYPGEEKDERHFHAYRRLLLAECNVALGKYEDARTELVEVRRLCDPNTNCYAYSNILEAYCLLSNDDAENYDKVVERLELALQNCPDCRHYLTHTAVLRKLSEYYARAEKYESALKRVTEAYLDDTREGGTEGGIEKDRDCFFKICVEAWNHYVKKGFNSYKNWHEFYTKEVVEGPMYRVFGDVLEESIRQKWLGVLNKWNCNGRNCSEEVLKSTDVLEYAYSADKIDTKNFETLLQENVHKALFIKVTDCLRMSAEEFKEKCKKFDLWLSSKLGLKGNDGYYPLDGDARLYIYEYKNEEGEILPVWHLICMK